MSVRDNPLRQGIDLATLGLWEFLLDDRRDLVAAEPIDGAMQFSALGFIH